MNRSGGGDEQPPVTPSALLPRTRRDSEPVSAPLEDAALVGLVLESDPAALEELYRRYGKACYGLSRRILGDEQLAQDVVQEVFLTLWRDASRYDVRRGAFSTWLLSMTHHRAVDVVRREENLRKRRAAAAAVEETAAPPEQPDEATWAGLRRERVRSALAALPAKQREALGLAYYGGYTQREIAGITDTPLGTVKTRMLAGMRRLRDVLDGVVNETPRADLPTAEGGAR